MKILSSHRENNTTHLCFYRKCSDRDFFSTLLEIPVQTTFRSFLEDLARRAEETVDENLKRLREAVDQTGVQHAKYLDEEAETELQRFQERLEKQGRPLTTRLEQVRVEGDRALQQGVQAALANFLRDLLHSAETANPSRPPAARRK